MKRCVVRLIVCCSRTRGLNCRVLNFQRGCDEKTCCKERGTTRTALEGNDFHVNLHSALRTRLMCSGHLKRLRGSYPAWNIAHGKAVGAMGAAFALWCLQKMYFLIITKKWSLYYYKWQLYVSKRSKITLYQYEMRTYSLKKHVKFGKMIKSDLFKVCSVACYTFFSSFGKFVNTTPLKIFPFCCEPFTEPFFHIFVRTETLPSKCVTHRCKRVGVSESESESESVE